MHVRKVWYVCFAAKVGTNATFLHLLGEYYLQIEHLSFSFIFKRESIFKLRIYLYICAVALQKMRMNDLLHF